MKSRPDVARASRSGMTAALAALFKGTGELLRERLDKLMALFAATDPGVHAGYKPARVVIDLRGAGDDAEPVP